MDDPLYSATITVGGSGSTYKFKAFSKELHSNQSFILQLTFIELGGAFDVSSATANLSVVGYKNSIIPATLLAAGVFTDSGSGTVDRVTFTVPKDLIPVELGTLPLGKIANSVFIAILEDSDSVLEFSQNVNVIDPDYNLTNDISIADGTIITQGNDLGTVEDTNLTTPPSPLLNLAYIVGVGATGDWATHDTELAIGNGVDWIFTAAEDGNFVFDKTAQAQSLFEGGVWAPMPVANGSVTNVKMGDMIAGTWKGRIAGIGTGSPNDNTTAAVKSDWDIDLVDNTSDLNKPVSSAQNAINIIKLDTTAQAADTAKVQGLLVDISNLSVGNILAVKAGLSELELVTPGAAGTGINSLPYVFNTATTATDPGSGGVKLDNASPASVLNIYISAINSDGEDLNTVIGTMGSGDTIQLKQNTTQFILFNIASIVDNTGWFTITGTIQTAGALMSNSASIIAVPFSTGTGTGGGLITFAGRSVAAAVPTSSDYDASQIDNDSVVVGAFVKDALETLNTEKLDEAAVDARVALGGGVTQEQASTGSNRDSSGAETLVVTDKDNVTITTTSVSDYAISIDTFANVAIPVGSKLSVIMGAAGIPTITGLTGVTVNGNLAGSVVMVNAQYQAISLYHHALNDWIISGSVA